MKVFGTVRSGHGDAKQWPPDLKAIYDQASGLDLMPGTLNLELPVPLLIAPFARRLMWNDQSILMAECHVSEHPCVIIRTETNELTQHRVRNEIVEVASDLWLRKHFDLIDGAAVELRVDD